MELWRRFNDFLTFLCEFGATTHVRVVNEGRHDTGHLEVSDTDLRPRQKLLATVQFPSQFFTDFFPFLTEDFLILNTEITRDEW